MQARVSVGVLLIMVTALAAGQREVVGFASEHGRAGAAIRSGEHAVVYRLDEAREDFRQVCALLDRGFVRPSGMDSLLAEHGHGLSRNVLHHIRSRAAFLTELSASQRTYCDALPDAQRRDLCYTQHPAAFMAHVLESFAQAIEGRRWADTPFGSADVRRWQRAGGRSRPGELMLRRCLATLLM